MPQTEKGAQNLTEPDKLRVRIENAMRNVRENYGAAVKTVAALKEKMNELEQRISRKKPEEVEKDMSSLRLAIESLNWLTDSQILKSKEAWKKYEELKHDCNMQTAESPQLDELLTLCKKTEQLAADLLCYSLGLLKRKSP